MRPTKTHIYFQEHHSRGCFSVLYLNISAPGAYKYGCGVIHDDHSQFSNNVNLYPAFSKLKHHLLDITLNPFLWANLPASLPLGALTALHQKFLLRKLLKLQPVLGGLQWPPLLPLDPFVLNKLFAIVCPANHQLKLSLHATWTFKVVIISYDYLHPGVSH